MDYRAVDKIKLKQWFIRFAEQECLHVSPFYYKLAKAIAEDDDLIAIAAHCRYRQPMPNLFFAAIHFLLLKNPNAALGQYYPSIAQRAKPDLPFALFKTFCLDRKKEIIEIERTRIVQTNVINRCAYIAPVLSNLLEEQAINLIDIGTSAGLTLHFDQYEYHYNQQYYRGNSPVKISSDTREGSIPFFKNIPKIKTRIGIDQNPLDITKKANAVWLKALIWADQTERIDRINQAIKIANSLNTKYIKANTLSTFEEIINDQDTSIPLVVYHTHVLYQFTKEEHLAFWELMDNIGKKRTLIYLAVEGSKVFQKNNTFGAGEVLVELNTYKSGSKLSKIAAITNGHANWIKWK